MAYTQLAALFIKTTYYLKDIGDKLLSENIWKGWNNNIYDAIKNSSSPQSLYPKSKI